MTDSKLSPSGLCCSPHLVNETLGPHGTEQPETVKLDLNTNDSDKGAIIFKEELSNSDKLLLAGASVVMVYGLYFTIKNVDLN